MIAQKTYARASDNLRAAADIVLDLDDPRARQLADLLDEVAFAIVAHVWKQEPLPPWLTSIHPEIEAAKLVRRQRSTSR